MERLSYPHIEARPDGTTVIAGTQVKVIEIALDHLAHQWTAEDIRHQYPELNLSQIYSALAYYFDNQAELDTLIEMRLKEEDRLLSTHADGMLQARLRAARHA